MRRSLTVLGVLTAVARGHISPWMESMYGIPELYPGLQNPVSPLGPGWAFDDWWFRGPGVRAAVPPDGAITLLPAGGTVTLELACDRYYTVELYGADPAGTVACDTMGPLHADPAGQGFYPQWVAGCALGIADVMDPNEATPDNFVVFSVLQECVVHRNATFEVPAKMPSCTGEWCICGWLWQPQTGDTNAYHTPFRCKVTDSPVDAGTIAFPLQDPVHCEDDPEQCTKGAKRMLMLYNEPTNVHIYFPADNRPRYDDTWGYFDGAQNDIFLAVDSPTTSTTTSSTSAMASTTNTRSTATPSSHPTTQTTSPPPSSSSTLAPPSASSSTTTLRTSTTSSSTTSRPHFFPAPIPTRTTSIAVSSSPSSTTLSQSTTSHFPIFYPAPVSATTTTRETTRRTSSPAPSTPTTTRQKWFIAPTSSPSSPSPPSSSSSSESAAAAPTPSRRLTFKERQALEEAEKEAAAAGRRVTMKERMRRRALMRRGEEL